jgi:hypothetical protein
MTPAHWLPVLQRAGGIVAAAAALGIDRDTVSAYAAGTRPTPRKVALAVAAWVAGMDEYDGGPASLWRPILTAAKGPLELSNCGPIIALASNHGHRALGYWGKGLGQQEGWINPHDHQRMDYWNAFAWWMPLAEVPK